MCWIIIKHFYRYFLYITLKMQQLLEESRVVSGWGGRLSNAWFILEKVYTTRVPMSKRLDLRPLKRPKLTEIWDWMPLWLKAKGVEFMKGILRYLRFSALRLIRKLGQVSFYIFFRWEGMVGFPRASIVHAWFMLRIGVLQASVISVIIEVLETT